ncbi:hypothetical protein [Thaumasiovibrio sp. DFM-14]|uniref:hypothetical protein n=1 Tax=Thaumasiovibrio sp. DFM-14 TaxID=3384792 RepID=UPI0039A01ED9
MTPVELLEQVKQRFHTLLHDDEQALKGLLRQALTLYQDKAGVIRRYRYQEGGVIAPFSLPSDFMSRISVTDSTGKFIPATLFDDELDMSLTGREVYPLILTYMVALGSVDLDEYLLPRTAIGHISDYLEILIKIPNSERMRRVATAGKLDTSDIPTEAELYQRKQELEDRIKDAKAMIPLISIS